MQLYMTIPHPSHPPIHPHTQDFTHGELLASLPSQYALDQLIRAQEETHYPGRARAWELPPHERAYDIALEAAAALAAAAARGEDGAGPGPRLRVGTPASSYSSVGSAASSLPPSAPPSPLRQSSWTAPSPTNVAAAAAPGLRQRPRHRKRPLSLHREHSAASSASSVDSGLEAAAADDQGGLPRVPSEDASDAATAQLDGSAASTASHAAAGVEAAALVGKRGAMAGPAGATGAGVGVEGIPASEGEALALVKEPPSAGLVRTVWHAVWG